MLSNRLTPAGTSVRACNLGPARTVGLAGVGLRVLERDQPVAERPVGARVDAGGQGVDEHAERALGAGRSLQADPIRVVPRPTVSRSPKTGEASGAKAAWNNTAGVTPALARQSDGSVQPRQHSSIAALSMVLVARIDARAHPGTPNGAVGASTHTANCARERYVSCTASIDVARAPQRDKISDTQQVEFDARSSPFA